MKFYLEHNKKTRCWKIYDMEQPETYESVCMMTIGDSLMDKYLTALLISNGAIEYKKEKKCLD